MLSAFQEIKLRIFFDLLDYDKNGFVELDDFLSIGENMIMMLQLEDEDPRRERILGACKIAWEDLYEYVDKNRDEKASIYEWLLYADKKIVNSEDDQYNDYVNRVVDHIFLLFDYDNDDHISIHEYLTLFMTFRLEARYSARAFEKLDLNQDDLISREELYKGAKEFFRSDDIDSFGNWLFGPWEEFFRSNDTRTEE